MAYLGYDRHQEALPGQEGYALKGIEQWLAMIWQSGRQARQSARFIQAILGAASARLSDIAPDPPE